MGWLLWTNTIFQSKTNNVLSHTVLILVSDLIRLNRNRLETMNITYFSSNNYAELKNGIKIVCLISKEKYLVVGLANLYYEEEASFRC